MSEFDRINETLDILQTDIHLIGELEDEAAETAVIQHRRREFVRAVFVYFEAVIFRLKQLAVYQATKDVVFSPSELSLLHEKIPRLSHSGIAQESPANLPLPENIKFTGKMFAKAHRTTFEGSYSEPGWSQLLKARQLRHRLTHPKDPADLTVSNEEVASMRTAYDWFGRWFSSLFDALTG